VTFSYEAVGRSLAPDLMVAPPRGFRASEHRSVIGSGRADFERQAARVLRWEVKTRAGFRVSREGGEPVVAGEVSTISFGPVRENVRVVRVVDEPRRRGFAYGTLPRHPLRGEEAFLVEHRDDGAVELVVRAFSRPNGAGWTLLWPLVVLARHVILRRYLRVLSAAGEGIAGAR
jgi:uncharacterized protein (UPF0548 family)